jgi:hypothetical protein
MKLNFKIIYFFILVFIYTGCSKNNSETKIQSQDILIPFQETKIIGSEEISITFSKILEDSRCPENSSINCVWQGRVLVEISMNTLDKHTISLGNSQSNSQNTNTNSFEYEGYLIQLIAVHPKRTEIQEPESSNYEIVLKINKI